MVFPSTWPICYDGMWWLSPLYGRPWYMQESTRTSLIKFPFKTKLSQLFFSHKVDIGMKTQIFFPYEYEGTQNPTWLQVWAWLQYLSMWWTYPLILQSDVTHWNWMTHCHYMSVFLRRFSQSRFISNNFSIPTIFQDYVGKFSGYQMI